MFRKISTEPKMIQISRESFLIRCKRKRRQTQLTDRLARYAEA